MIIKNIYSERKYQNWPSWHIVFEWEDALSKKLHLPILETPHIRNKWIRKINTGIRQVCGIDVHGMMKRRESAEKGISLYFEMSARPVRSFSNQDYIIPVIIDLWKNIDLQKFYALYKDCPCVLITSLEVMNFLKENDCPLTIVHFPISFPDQLADTPREQYSKKYDVVMVGRSNPVLWQFMQKYESTHRQIEYLYQTEHNGEKYYTSNKTGIVGRFHDRQSYLELLRSSRVCFYSTPGIDGGETRTGGFNPVTPRFLEILHAQSHVIARYPCNADTEFFELPSIAPHTDTYESFEAQMDHALISAPKLDRYADYLNRHFTSQRISILRELMDK